MAAFDWSLTAAAPAAVELGWYIAVNASRLVGGKERALARYRGLLETKRGERMSGAFWSRTEDLAVLTGALTLLWSKAMAVEAGAPWARDEWGWWAERLERLLGSA